MLLILALSMVLLGVIIGMEVNAALGFIIAVCGVAIVYLFEPLKKLFKRG